METNLTPRPGDALDDAPCPECNGTGDAPFDGIGTPRCFHCNGTGDAGAEDAQAAAERAWEA